MSLAFPTLSLMLCVAEEVALRIEAVDSVVRRIRQLFGESFQQRESRPQQQQSFLRVAGLFVDLSLLHRRVDDCLRVVFVNGRPLRTDDWSLSLLGSIDTLLVVNCYAALLPSLSKSSSSSRSRSLHCSFVVFVEIDDNNIDTDELRFDAARIDAAIVEAIKVIVTPPPSPSSKMFSDYTTALQEQQQQVSTSATSTKNDAVDRADDAMSIVVEDSNNDDNDNETALSIRDRFARWQSNPSILRNINNGDVDESAGGTRWRHEIVFTNDDVQHLRFIAQVARKFLVCRLLNRSLLVACDQHAIDERIGLEVHHNQFAFEF